MLQEVPIKISPSGIQVVIVIYSIVVCFITGVVVKFPFLVVFLSLLSVHVLLELQKLSVLSQVGTSLQLTWHFLVAKLLYKR